MRMLEGTLYEPGYYQVNYRALRLRELIRMRGWLRFPFTYFVTRRMRPSNPTWMPGVWTESQCQQTELSAQFRLATESLHKELERLGFSVCGFTKVRNHLNPNYRDSGGIRYLDKTGCHVAILLYVKVYAPPPLDRNREQVVVALTAFFERGSLSCTNNPPTFDPPAGAKVIRLSKLDPAPMYDRFLRKLRSCRETPRHFPDLASLRNCFDQQQLAAFNERVARGLFIHMSDAEVEMTRRRMPPPL